MLMIHNYNYTTNMNILNRHKNYYAFKSLQSSKKFTSDNSLYSKKLIVKMISNIIKDQDHQKIIDDKCLHSLLCKDQKQSTQFHATSEEKKPELPLEEPQSLTVSTRADSLVMEEEVEEQGRGLHELEHIQSRFRASILSVAWSADNKWIVAGLGDGSVKVLDVVSGQVVHDFQQIHKSAIRSVSLSNDNRYIITISSRDELIRIIEIDGPQGLNIHEIPHIGHITSIALTSDNKFIVSGSVDGTIRVFDLTTKTLVHQFLHVDTSKPAKTYSSSKATLNEVKSLTLTKDNQFVVVGYNDGSIKVFNLVDSKQVLNIPKAQVLISQVKVTYDSRYIITTSFDYSIKVFDFNNGQLVHHFKEAHEDVVYTATVTKDNRYLISASFDLSIKVFDLESKQEVHCFENVHKEQIKSLALSNDDKYIVSGSLDKCMKVFRLRI